MTGDRYDNGAAINVLKALEEHEYPDEALDLKIEVIMSEVEVLLTERGFTPSRCLREARRLNGSSEPKIPDGLLASGIADVVKKKMLGYDRADELPRTTDHLFKEAEAQVRANKGVEPVRLFIPSLDDAIGSGLYPGHVVVIVGHEGIMKSSVALHIVEENVWGNSSVRCLFFSLDMTPEMMAFRRISRYLGVHEQTVREMAATGTGDYLRAKEDIERLDDGRLHYVGGPLTLGGLTKQFDLLLPNLVVVDYLTLVTIPDEPNEFKTLRKVIDGLRALRDDTKATFVLLSQMGRASKLAAKAGQTGSHAFGGSIVEHLLDVELELVMDEPIEEDGQRRLVASITKNRFGPAGAAYEIEYQGIAKRITGKAWRLKKDKKSKPAFGERASIWDAPVQNNTKAKSSTSKTIKGANLVGLLPDEMTGVSLGEEIDQWMTLHPGLRDELLEQAERDYDPLQHDSVAGCYMDLARARYEQAQDERREFLSAYEAGATVDLATGEVVG